MSTDVTELIMLKYHITEYDKEIERINKAREELVEKLSRKCTHPTIKIDRQYFGGGYDYVSSVLVSHICTICEAAVQQYYDPKHKGTHG